MADQPEPSVRLDDFVELRRWQRLQDHFANVLGLGLRTVDSSRALRTAPSWPLGVDGARLVETLALGGEVETLLPDGASPAEIATVTTTLGLSFSAVPLRATAETVLGYLVAGPVVLGARETPEQFRARAHAPGLSAESVWPLLLTVKVYTVTGFRSVLQLLEEVTGMWLELAGQARALKTLLARASSVDPAVIAQYIDRLLHSLLEVATSATDAEGGSVMLYEPASDDFRIAAAQGLKAHVVNTARIKPKDSLAGLAVKTRQVLLVDDQVEDAQVRRRMYRQDLASSMVAPMVSDATAEPMGVLSVRTSRPADRFTSEDVELLHKLANLAQTALSGLSLLGKSGG